MGMADPHIDGAIAFPSGLLTEIVRNGACTNMVRVMRAAAIEKDQFVRIMQNLDGHMYVIMPFDANNSWPSEAGEKFSKHILECNDDVLDICWQLSDWMGHEDGGVNAVLRYMNDAATIDQMDIHGLSEIPYTMTYYLTEILGLPFFDDGLSIALKEIYLSEEDHGIKQERIRRALNIYYTKPQARNPSQRHIITSHKVTLIYKSGAKVTCNAKLSKSRSYLVLEPHEKDGAYYIFNGQVVSKESINVKKESYERLVHCEKNNAIVKEFLES
jgi:hypothetical protein